MPPTPLWLFCVTLPISNVLRLIRPFSFPSSIKDKSNPEDQSSWDSFKNMTPELSIVPGEQKDRMELHNKNWDSSSANTPDSSEGDFQTEVWGGSAALWYASPPRTPERLYISEFLQRFRTRRTPVSTDVLRRIRYCICLPPQRADAVERRLFYDIFSQKDYWEVRTGARHVCDWFLNEL